LKDHKLKSVSFKTKLTLKPIGGKIMKTRKINELTKNQTINNERRRIMKYRSFNLKSLIVAISLVGAVALTMPSLGFNGVAHAQEFTNESLQGYYSGIVTNEDLKNVMFGTFTADGNGNWSSSAKFNQSAPFGQRQVIDVTMTDGTYTVNADGTLFMTASFTIPNGVKVDAELDGVIRKTEIIDGVPIVTELIGFGRGGEIPSLMPGTLLTYDAKRLSD
jgi:hypothetical protein